ncbi:MAG: hypothetical protein QHI38_05385 [Armatimonadota bacterium]|nr:hypothetical protein [Armatimonadota bacterium]
MLFGKGQKQGDSKSLNTPVVAAVLVIVILGAGFMVFRFVRGSSPAAVPTSGTEGSPQAITPSPWEVPGGAPTPAPQSAQSGAPGPAPAGPQSPASPPAQSAPPSTTSQAPPQAPSQPTSPPETARPAASRASAAEPLEMRQITVFQKVTVSYPATWKIAVGGGNVAAVFTNGKAMFEVHPPDPKAANAKEIALRGVKSLVGNVPIQSQGQERIAGHDAFWVVVKFGRGSARIVGVDAPTRIVIFEHTTGEPLSNYKSIFDQMESSLSFAQ